MIFCIIILIMGFNLLIQNFTKEVCTMKRLILITAAILAMFTVAAQAEDIGDVIETDIITMIDHSPIASYNIDGYTYVIAEDLRNYGFDVVWDGEARTLSIDRAANVYAPYVPSDINTTRGQVTYKKLYDVYPRILKHT